MSPASDSSARREEADMTPITFNRYNPGAEDKTVIIERITHWELIRYNGYRGTRIFLDTGVEVHTREEPHEVEAMIKKAFASLDTSTSEQPLRGPKCPG